MSMQFESRRQFLTAAAATTLMALPSADALACFWRRRRRCCCVVQPLPPPPPPPPTALRIRQNIASLNEQQLSSLKNGVAAMKALPASDPRSWVFQANIHGTMSPVTSPLFNQCEHGTLLFFAWHRGYLYYFERILRWAAGDPQLTLPYWDWSTAPDIPVAYRIPADSSNPLFDNTRFINDGSALPSSVVVDDLNNGLAQIPFPPSGFLGFSPSVEGSPHGAVHVLIGGNMGFVPTAANDPVFWLHHGNIDRVWDKWLSLGGGRTNPSDNAFLDTPYSFADESGNTVNLTVRDILSSEQLGYRYDDVPPSAAPSAMLAAARFAGQSEERMAIRVSSSHAEAAPAAEGKALGLQPETVKLQVLPQQLPTLRAATEAARPGQTGTLVLQIEGLSLADVPNFTYGVYLNLPEGDVSAEQARVHRVGTINFFGRGASGDAPHQHEKEQNFTERLDATATVARLKRSGQWNPDALSVTLRPVFPIAPKGEEESQRKRLEESASRAKIRYQRIDLLANPPAN